MISLTKLAAAAAVTAAVTLTAGALPAQASTAAPASSQSPHVNPPPSINGAGCPKYTERAGNDTVYQYNLMYVYAPNHTFYVGHYDVYGYIGGTTWWHTGEYEYLC